MKSKLIQDGPDKTYAVVFDTGDEVVAGLLEFAKQEGIGGAHLTAIGAFERVTLGFFEVEKKEYRKIPIEEQVELLSLVGNIAQDDTGNPKVHAHVVVGKSDATAYGGHLLEAYVRPTLEVIVVESRKHLLRRMRPELGVALLDLTREVHPRARDESPSTIKSTTAANEDSGDRDSSATRENNLASSKDKATG